MEFWYFIGILGFGGAVWFSDSKTVQVASASMLIGIVVSYNAKLFGLNAEVMMLVFSATSFVVFAVFAWQSYKDKKGIKFHHFEPREFFIKVVEINDKHVVGQAVNGQQLFKIQTLDNLGDVTKAPKGLILGESYEVESHYVPGDFLIVKIPTIVA
jgi:hypothetical protein